MDAVSTFGDVEDPWNIQCRKSPFGVNKFGHGPTVSVTRGWAG